MSGPYKTPTGIGSKDRSGPETSREAAETHAVGFREMREKVFDVIFAAGATGLTPDEVALAMGADILSVRPRISELRDAERVVPNGERRRNAKKNSAAVVVAAQFAPPQVDGDDAADEPAADEPEVKVQGSLL